jgi:hypothetical protein
MYECDEFQEVKELGTAMPYGCNDNIKGVGNWSSPGCSENNVMSLFNTNPRAKRNHGHKRSKLHISTWLHSMYMDHLLIRLSNYIYFDFYCLQCILLVEQNIDNGEYSRRFYTWTKDSLR